MTVVIDEITTETGTLIVMNKIKRVAFKAALFDATLAHYSFQHNLSRDISIFAPQIKRMQHQFKFSKNERLSSKKTIDKLFTDGNALFAFPFRIIVLPCQPETSAPVQVLFSVPKKNFKRAVHRNLIKRRMREAYRLNRNSSIPTFSTSDNSIAIMFIYIEKEIKDYAIIEKGMKKALSKIDQLIATTR